MIALPEQTRHRRKKRKKKFPKSLPPVTWNLIQQRLDGPVKIPLCIAYGMGVDSTAVLVFLARMYHQGIKAARPDLITFADTGGEKRETYEYFEVINRWLISVGFPTVTVVRLGSDRYNSLEEECLIKRMLVSLAYPGGPGGANKGCSLKWKKQAQDAYRRTFPDCVAAWEAGERCYVMIGYDAGPADLRRKAIDDDSEYRYWYPLRELGWDREQCKEQIAREGLPVPMKSACWFCPANTPLELLERSRSPHGREELRRIIRMEANAHDMLQGNWSPQKLAAANRKIRKENLAALAALRKHVRGRRVINRLRIRRFEGTAEQIKALNAVVDEINKVNKEKYEKAKDRARNNGTKIKDVPKPNRLKPFQKTKKKGEGIKGLWGQGRKGVKGPNEYRPPTMTEFILGDNPENRNLLEEPTGGTLALLPVLDFSDGCDGCQGGCGYFD